jgi:1-acyl-sn-glycerol-3-phosphate acyltransferase
LKIEVFGQQNLKDPSIIIVNHQSILDIIVISYLKLHYSNLMIVAKKELLYYNPFLGIAAIYCQCQFINRQNNKSSTDCLNEIGKRIKVGNVSHAICSYADGRKNKINYIFRRVF